MKIRRSEKARWAIFVVGLIGASTLAVRPAMGYLPVIGGPTYDTGSSTGVLSTSVPFFGVTSAGTILSQGELYNAGTDLGSRAYRWDTAGDPPIQLDTVSTNTSGYTVEYAYGISSDGSIFGESYLYNGDTSAGSTAVKWGAGTTSATPLGNLGIASAAAYAVNTGGTAVGFAGLPNGNSAVYWAAGGTLATQLGNLGTGSNGYSNSTAAAINSGNTIVGSSEKYSSGFDEGPRAVEWAAGSTTATELGNFGTQGGYTVSAAVAINDNGTACGQATMYNSPGSSYIATRWDAGTTSATALGFLGTDSSGNTSSAARGINSAGTIVGQAYLYDSSHNPLGYRATRWDAGTTSATQLGILSTNLSGVGNADAYEINDSGLAVGLEDQYSGNTDEGQHAMLWTANGTAIDLNSLIDPNSGWTLAFASSINDNDIVEGMGTFDPDGSGPDPGYERAFILDVSSVAQTPEPTSLLALAGLTLLARRRR